MIRRLCLLCILLTVSLCGCEQENSADDIVEARRLKSYEVVFGVKRAYPLFQADVESETALLLEWEGSYIFVDLQVDIAYFYKKTTELTGTEQVWQPKSVENESSLYQLGDMPVIRGKSTLSINGAEQGALQKVSVLPDIEKIIDAYKDYLIIYGEYIKTAVGYDSSFQASFIQLEAVVRQGSGYRFETADYPPYSLVELLDHPDIVSSATVILKERQPDAKDIWYIARTGSIVLLRYNGSHEVIPCA